MAGAAAEHQRLGNGVAGQSVSAIGAADCFAGREEPGQIRLHLRVGYDAAHVVMRDRRHLDRHFGEINAISGETVNDRAKGFAKHASGQC